MKASFGRDNLISALESVAGVADGKIKPVLRNALIGKSGVTQEGKGWVSIEATNLACAVRTSCPFDGEWAPALLPAQALLKICRQASADNISVEQTPSGVVITCRFSRWELPTDSVGDFPEYIKDPGQGFEVDSASLFRAIEAVRHVPNRNEANYSAIASVFFEVRKGELHITKTDTNSICSAKFKIDCPEEKVALLPPEHAAHFAGVLGFAEKATLKIGYNDLSVTCGGATFYSRQIEGRYPEWRDFIPKKAPLCEFSVIAQGNIAQSLKRCMAAADSETFHVTLNIGKDDVELTFNSDGRTGKDRFRHNEFSGEPVTVKAQSSAINTALRAFKADEALKARVYPGQKKIQFINSDESVTSFVMPAEEK